MPSRRHWVTFTRHLGGNTIVHAHVFIRRNFGSFHVLVAVLWPPFASTLTFSHGNRACSPFILARRGCRDGEKGAIEGCCCIHEDLQAICAYIDGLTKFDCFCLPYDGLGVTHRCFGQTGTADFFLTSLQHPTSFFLTPFG